MQKIPLTQSQFALVDDKDFPSLNKHKWYAHKKGGVFYAMRMTGGRGNRKMIPMHAAIVKTPKGMETDHRDGDGLNNQRKNLRVCTHAENSRNKGKHSDNTSGHKGVYWSKQIKRWVARIMVNGKAFHLGTSLDKEVCHRLYVNACKKLHGKFAK